MKQITTEQVWAQFAQAVNDLCIWEISDKDSANTEYLRYLFYIEGLRTMAELIDGLIHGENEK